MSTCCLCCCLFDRERLKERMNKNRTSDTASVTSSVQAADEVMSFEDLEDSKH